MPAYGPHPPWCQRLLADFCPVDPLTRLRAAAAERTAAGLHRELRPRVLPEALLDLAGNDYLGLSRHPAVVAGAIEATRRWGAGSTGSRLVTGSTALHADLEGALASFVGTPAALVLSSGYCANLAAVVALSGPGTLVVSDAANHASIVDACRLSRARVVVTPHRSLAAVERALAARPEPYALVVSDSVFSTDGRRAPVADLHRVARRHGALLLLDEAHALGVVGPRGQGAAHQAALAGEPDVVLTATLSKALGSQGGVVLGAPEVIAHLVNAARPFIFDTGLAPSCVGAARAALDLLSADPGLPAAARESTAAIARLAAEAGLPVETGDAAVCAVVLGEPDLVTRAVQVCADHGVRVGCFRPPSVPAGRCCLRVTGRADLSEDDLGQLAVALKAVAALAG
jgi:8-amino-7-oxononanoate synthase